MTRRAARHLHDLVSRWLARRRDDAAMRWHMERRMPGMVTPALASARRRFDRWDALLDAWTARERATNRTDRDDAGS